MSSTDLEAAALAYLILTCMPKVPYNYQVPRGTPVQALPPRYNLVQCAYLGVSHRYLLPYLYHYLGYLHYYTTFVTYSHLPLPLPLRLPLPGTVPTRSLLYNTSVGTRSSTGALAVGALTPHLLPN